eukprot:scaffold63644_cov46-Attheya_sp.AAC.2
MQAPMAPYGAKYVGGTRILLRRIGVGSTEPIIAPMFGDHNNGVSYIDEHDTAVKKKAIGKP